MGQKKDHSTGYHLVEMSALKLMNLLVILMDISISKDSNLVFPIYLTLLVILYYAPYLVPLMELLMASHL